MSQQQIEYVDYDYVRNRLLNREEIGLLDVREEAPHAEGHPLFAANYPYSRIELEVYTRLPRRNVTIVVIDDGEGLSEASAKKLVELGYSQVNIFRNGIAGWKNAGGELFIDVNVPSKSFGELLEAKCETPSLPAEEVKKLVDSNPDAVFIDVRPYDEYHAMSIPRGINVPGAELLLHIADVAKNPDAKIIINCAGRTRGLLGTQSLINAGIPNAVAALRNGTIGWTLARQTLDVGQTRTFPTLSKDALQLAQSRARGVADRAVVSRATLEDLDNWRDDDTRTTYYFDVRTPEEYQEGHFAGFVSAPGGQLVQETEMNAPVRGARIVLIDDDGVRANMTASWLVQMDWEVYVLDEMPSESLTEQGKWNHTRPDIPSVSTIDANELAAMHSPETVVLDFSRYASYQKAHIPGAFYILRSALEESLGHIPQASNYILTDEDGSLSPYIVPEFKKLVTGSVHVLNSGNRGWSDAGRVTETDKEHLASQPIDRYQRPYIGTNVSEQKMQAYLDWEFGLVEQLDRDSSHHFNPRPLF